MRYRRMPIEIESPEQMGYKNIRINLTESSYADAVLGDLDLDLKEVVLCYGDHAGKRALREDIAAGAGGLSAEDVLITAGAASALFIIATSLLESGDHIIVARPNYATNIETPRAIGCAIDSLELRFEQGFQLDLARVAGLLRPNTRIVSVTLPHNPSGTTATLETLMELIRIVERHGCLLLLDETYREMAFGDPLPMGASLSPRVVSVCSLSKTFGLPGIRIGWLICRDRGLMETFLAAKEQMLICNSVVDEEIAHRSLQRRAQALPRIRQDIAGRFAMVKRWMDTQDVLEWIEPQAGVVCFPRIRADAGVDVERFYQVLGARYGTFVGPGHWFEMERRYMRIGFGWPRHEDLAEGLDNIGRALSESRAG